MGQYFGTTKSINEPIEDLHYRCKCIALNGYKIHERIKIPNVGFHMFRITRNGNTFVVKFAPIRSGQILYSTASRSIEFKQYHMTNLIEICTEKNITLSPYLLQWPSDEKNVASWKGMKEAYFYIITEYYEFGTLGDKILNVEKLNTIITQMMHAIDSLHQCNFSHDDISPENIGIRNLNNIEVSLFDLEHLISLDSEIDYQLNNRVARVDYSSIRAHKCLQALDGDDYESLYFIV